MRLPFLLVLALAACGDDAAVPSDAGGVDLGPPDGCQTGYRVCDMRCTNVTSDPFNCGGCGATCPTGELCASARCVGSCPGSLTECGQSCVDLDLANEHCGECGHACGDGMVCQAGSCDCVDGLTLCDGFCVDTDRTSQHCGICGRACDANRACLDGTCRVPTEVSCDDGTDDDADGDTDCDDVDCRGFSRVCECPMSTPGMGTQVCEVGAFSDCGPCLPAECGPMAPCQAQGFECNVNNGSCELDERALFDIELQSVDVPRADVDGYEWDPCLPFPFWDYEPELAVEVVSGGMSWQRDLMDNLLNTTTYNAAINERTVRGVEARDLMIGVRVKLSDRDGASDNWGCQHDLWPADDVIGDCSFEIPVEHLDGRVHVYDCQRTSEASGFRVRLAFKQGTSS